MMAAKIFLLFSAALARVAGEVTVLTDSSWDAVVGQDHNVLVELYAPWCGHCKHLEPEYNVVGSVFNKDRDGVVIAKVDCTAEKGIALKEGVKGYPTLKWYPKGSKEGQDFNAARTADAIAQAINEKTGLSRRISKAPSAITQLTSANFRSIARDPEKTAFVMFSSPTCGHCKALEPAWEALAKAFAGEERVVIAKVDATAERDLADAYGVSGYPTLKLFGSGSGSEPEPYTGGRDIDTLLKFVNEAAGTERNEQGEAGPMEGRLAVLDGLLAGRSIDSELVQQLESEVVQLKGTQQQHGDIYLRAARKALESGPEYLQKEADRLSALLKAQGVSPAKRNAFMLKRNVLAAMQEAAAAASA